MVNLYQLVHRLQDTMYDETKPAQLREKAANWLAEIRWMYRGEG